MLTQLVEVTYGPGTLPLFDGFTLAIEDGLRLGVVGENGSGKTTLIRLIAGDISPERGEVVRRTGVRIAGLAQDDRALLAEDPPVAEYLYHSDAERELERLGAAMGTEASLGGARLAELSRAYDRALDAMASDESPDPALARDVLNDLGLRRIPEQRRMSELSGGQRRLIELARTLALQPDLLLLDEPEAHLDMRARGWLGSYLRGLRSSVVMVSHDRYMLETAATAVLDITAGRNDRYGGGYSFFLEERPKLWARREKEFQLQTERVDRIQQQFYMFREWARLNSDFASRARARLKMLERAKAQVQQPAPRSARTMTLAFRSEARGRIMVEGTAATYAYPDGPTIGPLDVVLERGDRVALVGPNGAGKSTLLALLSGRLAPSGGKLRLKEGMRIATLAQESLVEGLEATPLEVIVDTKPMAQDEVVRRICALGLSYQHCVSPMSRLSGGQRVRVHLLRVSLEQPDLLLLDEPTNYIDTDSAEVVQTALEEFTGCVVAATHDRWLVETYATRVLVMEPDAHGARLRETEPAALESAPYG